MPTSRWAEYLAIVAEITGMHPTEIWRTVDLVAGYHYTALWFEKRGCPLRANTRESTSAIIQ